MVSKVHSIIFLSIIEDINTVENDRDAEELKSNPSGTIRRCLIESLIF